LASFIIFRDKVINYLSTVPFNQRSTHQVCPPSFVWAAQ